jgi:hypothetical protein
MFVLFSEMITNAITMLIVSFDVQAICWHQQTIGCHHRPSLKLKRIVQHQTRGFLWKQRGKSDEYFIRCPVVCGLLICFFVDISSPYLTEFNGRYPSGKVSGRSSYWIAWSAHDRDQLGSYDSVLIRRCCDIVYGWRAWNSSANLFGSSTYFINIVIVELSFTSSLLIGRNWRDGKSGQLDN